ncbi:MAG: TIGR01440 family protein [Oscillospiraceae bacterium]|nr:TIGR01440 family protein [Oscillospiraceae bacterium]
MLEQVKTQTAQAMNALLSEANLTSGDLFVVGCSTSEVTGAHIGKAGSLEIAEAIFQGLMPALSAVGLHLAVQCCEHLNRALVVERQVALAKGFTIVAAVPHPTAGGAFAAFAWAQCSDPVLVESIQAQAGLDIGGTLIGMHLAPVAVPVRLETRQIGDAPILAAKTRPKLIGGARACYE